MSIGRSVFSEPTQFVLSDTFFLLDEVDHTIKSSQECVIQLHFDALWDREAPLKVIVVHVEGLHLFDARSDITQKLRALKKKERLA